LDRALDGSRHVVISGPPGSGKSAVASELVSQAESAGRVGILVRPPSGATDAGVLALAGVARRLGGADAVRGGWATLRPRVTTMLRERRDEIVIVVDEPSSWAAAGGVFARRADEAAETLWGLRSEWPTIVCDQGVATGALQLPRAAREDLITGDWGLLTEAAVELSSAPLAAASATPLQLRLATALLAWGAEPIAGDAHRLGMQLAETLAPRRHGSRLWAVWQRLALARTALTADALEQLGAGGLDGLSTATLQIALLDGAGRLHDVLRTIPEDRPVSPELAAEQREDAHRKLYAHHFARFAAAGEEDPAEAGDHAAEALFHAGELDDETSQQLVRVDLVEQLDAVGHRLGTVHGNHVSAADAYRRALDTDEHDAHATHHLAYHLDAQGRDADAVASGYERALKIEPGRAHWHGRRVAFLANVARLSDARRAWHEAESALADDRGDAALYDEMHVPVAANLLAVGELSFCDYVLGGVPLYARSAQHRELRRLLDGRLAGQDRGSFVPAPRSGRTWWREAPDRLPARDTAGRRLTTWMAGRVETVDEMYVEIHVIHVDAEEGPVRPGLARITLEDLAGRLLDDIEPQNLTPGRFVEIGRYRSEGAEDRTGIVVLDPDPVRLPVDILDPARWLRARVVHGTAVND
jgi:hypothetical protein